MRELTKGNVKMNKIINHKNIAKASSVTTVALSLASCVTAWAAYKMSR